jgi:membrane fusion protein (multidrug efflux system)
MKKSYNRWIAIGVIVLLAIGLFLYNFLGKKKDSLDVPVSAGRAQSVLPVRGMIISQAPLTLKLDNIQATLVPDEEVDLSFETSGKITNIYFSEDTAVRKGELLAKINDQPLQAQLKKLEAQVQLAQDRLFRQSALLEKDAVSREAYEQAQTELAMLNADIDLVKANIAQTELRAPFDGVLGFRYVSEGAYANPTTAIARLTKTVPLKLDFSIPEKYMDAVRRGTKINFAVEGMLDSFAAEVYAVSSEVDLATRQLDVKALYPNSRGQLMPGRSAAVSIILYETDNAIVVPAEAVIKEMGVDKVYVYRAGKAQPVSIEAGQRTDSQVEVITGVVPGDTLITTGTLQLRQSLPVTLGSINR